MGSTFPRSVISPVIATSERTGRPESADPMAAATVMPAEGPSFGTPAAGKWTWMSQRPNASDGMSSDAARERT